MQEIVNKVLAAEQAAEKRIEEARSEAAAIRSKADKEAAHIVAEARDQANSLLQQTVAEARARADKEHAKRIEKIRTENQAFLARQEKKIGQAVEAVVTLVVNPEWSE